MSYFDDIYNKYMQDSNRYATSFGLDQNSAHNGEWDAFPRSQRPRWECI